eukprot:2304470-Prymnesium_polylepis.1
MKHGGAVSLLRDSSALLLRCCVKSCAAVQRLYGDGGAFFTAGGELTIAEGSFLVNCSASWGGSIYSYDAASRIMVINSSVCYSSASLGGGSLKIVRGTVSVCNGSLIVNSTTESVGGAISVSGGTVVLSASSIVNSMARRGGALHCEGGDTTVSGCRIVGSTSSLSGGAAYVFGGILKVTG